MNRRLAKYAKVHGEVFIPGVGTVGSTLPPNNKTFKSFEMVYDLEGLHVTANGISVIIPPTSVFLVQLVEAEEPLSPPAPKAKK